MYVSFANCKAIVFWAKNLCPLIPLLKELDERGIHYYFQFTMNDYEKDGFEPNVPSLQKRIETFKELSQLIGKEKVIWRFDPLIVTPQLTPRELLTRIWHIGNAIKGYTDKLFFSFIDINGYRKVQSNLVKETNSFSKETVENSEFTQDQMNEIAEGLAICRDAWAKDGWQISLGTCAEKVDLEQYGIEHNRCIDGKRMKRIFADHKYIVYYKFYVLLQTEL
jgi:DNA repair photolyase